MKNKAIAMLFLYITRAWYSYKLNKNNHCNEIEVKLQ